MKKIFALSFILDLAISACLFAAETPEVNKIRWARANSGNVLVTLAKNNGYLKEYGLEIIEMPLNSATDALTALNTKQVDVTSNQGTNNPFSLLLQVRTSRSWAATCSKECISLLERALAGRVSVIS